MTTADRKVVNAQVDGQHADALASLRAELDEIDRQLLDILRRRLECCARIAGRKRTGGIPMMQPSRIELVQARAREYATEHDINPDFLRAFYELLIAESCRLEDAIINDTRDIFSSISEPTET